eukprot:6262151-Prymnesium_polylepis.1
MALSSCHATTSMLSALDWSDCVTGWWSKRAMRWSCSTHHLRRQPPHSLDGERPARPPLPSAAS